MVTAGFEDVDDVEEEVARRESLIGGLEKYLENKREAERLEEEIAELDAEIDARVFELYGLDEGEIKTVLDSLDTDPKERNRIMSWFHELDSS